VYCPVCAKEGLKPTSRPCHPRRQIRWQYRLHQSICIVSPQMAGESNHLAGCGGSAHVSATNWRGEAMADFVLMSTHTEAILWSSQAWPFRFFCPMCSPAAFCEVARLRGCVVEGARVGRQHCRISCEAFHELGWGTTVGRVRENAIWK